MYCCNMRTESLISPEKWKNAMNGVLPHDIAVTDCREVPFEFHARYDCSGKRYVYRIWNAQERNPFISRYSYHYKYPLDADFLNRQAAEMLVDNVRTLTRAEVVRRGDEVLMYFEADGFLYNMVRIMAGTLLDISRGRIAPDSVRDIISSLDRDRAGATAPACGLCLERVFYNGKD